MFEPSVHNITARTHEKWACNTRYSFPIQNKRDFCRPCQICSVQRHPLQPPLSHRPSLTGRPQTTLATYLVWIRSCPFLTLFLYQNTFQIRGEKILLPETIYRFRQSWNNPRKLKYVPHLQEARQNEHSGVLVPIPAQWGLSWGRKQRAKHFSFGKSPSIDRQPHPVDTLRGQSSSHGRKEKTSHSSPPAVCLLVDRLFVKDVNFTLNIVCIDISITATVMENTA